jgi:hypothetical protein
VPKRWRLFLDTGKGGALKASSMTDIHDHDRYVYLQRQEDGYVEIVLNLEHLLVRRYPDGSSQIYIHEDLLI